MEESKMQTCLQNGCVSRFIESKKKLSSIGKTDMNKLMRLRFVPKLTTHKNWRELLPALWACSLQPARCPVPTTSLPSACCFPSHLNHCGSCAAPPHPPAPAHFDTLLAHYLIGIRTSWIRWKVVKGHPGQPYLGTLQTTWLDIILIPRRGNLGKSNLNILMDTIKMLSKKKILAYTQQEDSHWWNTMSGPLPVVLNIRCCPWGSGVAKGHGTESWHGKGVCTMRELSFLQLRQQQPLEDCQGCTDKNLHVLFLHHWETPEPSLYIDSMYWKKSLNHSAGTI